MQSACLKGAKDRDRGEPRGSAPPTPPGPYTAVREVTLTRFDQGRETERFEVGVGESHGEGFAPGEMPGSTTATGHVAQLPRDSERDKCRSPAPWCFPLAPEGSPQSQADPASESNQLLGRFAKAEIAAPTQHIPSQFLHCRLDADALGPSCDVPDSLLEPVQRFRRNRALDVRTSRKAEPEELPFLRSCHRTLRLIYLELTIALVTPVMFPPGWLRLATRPSATGSAPIKKTMGIVEVAALAARAGRLLPMAAISDTR